MIIFSGCVLSGNAEEMLTPQSAQQTNVFIRLRTRANEKVSTSLTSTDAHTLLPFIQISCYGIIVKGATHTPKYTVAKQNLVSYVLFLIIPIAFSPFRWITLFGD